MYGCCPYVVPIYQPWTQSSVDQALGQFLGWPAIDMTGKELIKAVIKDVPLIFNDPSYSGSIDWGYLCLTYAVDPFPGIQTRFKNRLVAKPKVDLTEYEFKAVLDWLEIYLPTKGIHQARNVQQKLMKLNQDRPGFSSCYVRGPRREERYVGNAFVIKMQDPQPATLYGLLRRILEHYCSHGTGLDEIPITGMELSLDVAPSKIMHFEEQAYVARRMLMTELIRKHVSVEEAFRKGKRTARFVHGDEDDKPKTQKLIKAPRMTSALRKLSADTGIERTELAVLNPTNHVQPFLDATFYYGDKDERLLFRCMDKITDRRTKLDATKLPFRKTRSRIEFTLQDEIPLDGLGPASVNLTHFVDLQMRGIVGFNHLLLFDVPTFTRNAGNMNEPDETEWMIFQKTGVAGLRYYQDVSERMHGVKTRRAEFSSGKSLRDKDMNRRVMRAIKRLNTAWGADWDR